MEVAGSFLRRRGGKWVGVVRLRDGARVRQRTKTFGRITKSRALQLLAEWERECSGPSCSMTVGEYCRAYLASIEHTLEPSTVSGYRCSLKHVCEGLGGIPLAGLRPHEVQAWEAELTARGLSSSTVGKAHRILKQVMKHAVESGDLPRNPLSTVKPPRRKAPSPNYLDKAGRDRLLGLLAEMRGPLATAATIALYTGMRRGEVCALRWADVDMGRGEIRVCRSVGVGAGGAYLKEAKTAAGKRCIPMPQALKTALMALQGHSYVIGGDTFYNPTRLGRQWASFAESFGIMGTEGRVCTFHDLRHTYATVAIASGADVRSVAAILGHADASVTLNVYAAADAEAMRRAASLVGRAL